MNEAERQKINEEWKELTRPIWEPMQKEWLKEIQERDALIRKNDALIREKDAAIRVLQERLRNNGLSAAI